MFSRFRLGSRRMLLVALTIALLMGFGTNTALWETPVVAEIGVFIYQSEEESFTGTWQGPDPDDDSTITLSLTQRGRELEGTFSDTYSGYPDGTVIQPGFSGPGSGELLSATEAWMTFDLTRPDGATLGLEFRMTLSNQNNTLMLSDVIANGNPIDWSAVLQRQEEQPGVTVDVVEADNTALEATVRFPEAQMLEVEAGGEIWTQLFVAGIEVSGGNGGSSGQPDVPIYRRLAAVPRGCQVSVIVEDVAMRDLLTELNLYPVQPEPRDQGGVGYFGNLPFEKDREAYARDEFFPSDLVQVTPLGRLRDLELIQVSVAAAQYNPLRQLLKLYDSIDFKLQFEGCPGYFLPKAAEGPFEPSARSLYDSVLNEQVIWEYIEPDITSRICVGYEYHIITDPKFRAAADALAKWKKAKGVSTKVVETASGTTREQIQSYIRDQFNHCFVRPSYVLLLGDAEHISPWYRTTMYGDSAGTDLDYSLMNSGDILPDLAVGRIPVDTLPQAQTVVNKIINYEKNPTSVSTFYENLSFASYFQCCRSGVKQKGVTQRGFIETAEFVRDHLTGEGYSVERIYNTNTKYSSSYSGDTAPRRYYNSTLLPTALDANSGFAWNGDTQDIIDAINAGHFLMLHRDHGSKSGWSDPSFTTGHLNKLKNGALLPVVFSVNCSSGLFDNETDAIGYGTTKSGVYFAEAMLRLANGGAVGVLGDTRDSPTWANNALTRSFFDAIWPGVLPNHGSSTSIRRLGDILNSGKVYMNGQVGQPQAAGSIGSTAANTDIVLWHVFGDPTMELWTSKPLHILIPKFTVLSRTTLNWQIGYDIEGATITILQDGSPLGRAKVVDGVADIALIQELAPDFPIDELTISASLPGAISMPLKAREVIEHLQWDFDQVMAVEPLTVRQMSADLADAIASLDVQRAQQASSDLPSRVSFRLNVADRVGVLRGPFPNVEGTHEVVFDLFNSAGRKVAELTVIIAATATVGPGREDYADRVVKFRPGIEANPDFGNPGDALGPPDRTLDPPGGFVHLGVGGSITVEFTDNVVVDGYGDDLRIWGDPANDELIQVEVSADGIYYRSFGLVEAEIGEMTRLDLADVGLSSIRFVRITDDGSREQLGSGWAGAELDAVEALASAIVPVEMLFRDDFEDGVANGWELARGWRVEQENDNYFLSGEGLYQWAIPNTGYDWTNYALRCRLKLINGGIHLNFRLRDQPREFTRYFIGFRKDTLYLHKEHPPGNYPDLVGKEIDFDLNVWHDVEIAGDQGHLQIYVDGRLELEYDDPNPLLQGTIAFETIEEPVGTEGESSHAHIDDVEVTGLR